MKHVLLTFLILLLATSAYPQVTLLVQSKEFWQKSKAVPIGTTKDSTEYFADMLHQTQRGDIIVIKEVTHQWGKLERPPSFVRVDISDMTLEDALKFTQPLIDSALYDGQKSEQPDSVDIKERRWHFSEAFVDSALAQWAFDKTDLSMTSAQAGVFILEYDKATVKQQVRERSK